MLEIAVRDRTPHRSRHHPKGYGRLPLSSRQDVVRDQQVSSIVQGSQGPTLRGSSEHARQPCTPEFRDHLLVCRASWPSTGRSSASLGALTTSLLPAILLGEATHCKADAAAGIYGNRKLSVYRQDEFSMRTAALTCLTGKPRSGIQALKVAGAWRGDNRNPMLQATSMVPCGADHSDRRLSLPTRGPRSAITESSGA